MVYQIQLDRGTENNVGFTTKLVYSIEIKCIIFIGMPEFFGEAQKSCYI